MQLRTGTFAALGLLLAAQAAVAEEITIGTGGDTGLYYATGKNICAVMSAKGHQCTANVSAGSVANLKALHAGEIDVAVVQSDWQYHAYRGSSQWVGEKMPGLRALFSAYAEPLQIVASEKSGIKKFKDLNGKRINIGNPGSGQRQTVELMFESMRVKHSAFAAVTEYPSSDHVDRFCNDEFDAFFFTVGIPNKAMQRAVVECSGFLIEPDSRAVRKLATAARPYYSKVRIPKGTYRDDQKRVNTFGVNATLVVSESMDAKKVEAVLDAVFSDFEAFKALHPAYAQAEPSKMIKDGLSAPLHPAAEAYYKAKGWL